VAGSSRRRPGSAEVEIEKEGAWVSD